MPDDPEIKKILGDIYNALKITGAGTGGGSVSQLIDEVRQALRGGGEPTVSSSIRDLKTTMSHEFQILRDHLNNTGGRGTGGTAPPREAGGHGELSEAMTRLLTHLDDVLDRLERATVSFERLGGHAAGMDGAPRPYQEREVYLSAIAAVEKLWKTGTTAADVWSSFNGLIKDQTIASFKAMATSAFDIGLNLSNLGTQFRNLRSVLGKEIGELSSGGVFGSNTLGPAEYFMEGPKRAVDGVLFETDSFRTALKLAHSAIQDDMISPLSLTGKSITELSGDFHRARQDMREKFGFDTRGWMATDDANKAIYSMMEYQRRTGIQSLNAQVDAERTASQELSYLSIIATMTGQTVTQLEQQTQANRRQNDIMVGMGRMTGDEAAMSARISTGLEARLGKSGAQGIMDTLNQLNAYGRDRGQILANPSVPQDFKNLFATIPEAMERFIQINNERMMKLAPGENEDARTNRIIGEIAGLGSSLQRFTSMGRTDVPSQVAIFGSMQEMLSRAKIASNIASGLTPPDAAQMATRDKSEVYSFIQTMKEWWREQISPFFGLPAALTANTFALAANTVALFRMTGVMGISSLFGGFGGGGAAAAAGGGTIASRLAGGLGRAAPVLGGIVGAGTAYMEGSSAVGVAGAGLGGAGGAYGGAILGTAIAGPIGTVIGGILGSFLGSWLGQKAGEQVQSPTRVGASSSDVTKMVSEYQQRVAEQTPAVTPPTNVFGPQSAAVAASTNSTYQDSSLSLLTQIIQTGAQGNYILGQMYGELARQTGYLSGNPTAGGGISYNGQGLAANVAPVVTGTRPSDSNPYVGPGA